MTQQLAGRSIENAAGCIGISHVPLLQPAKPLHGNNAFTPSNQKHLLLQQRSAAYTCRETVIWCLGLGGRRCTEGEQCRVAVFECANPSPTALRVSGDDCVSGKTAALRQTGSRSARQVAAVGHKEARDP